MWFGSLIPKHDAFADYIRGLQATEIDTAQVQREDSLDSSYGYPAKPLLTFSLSDAITPHPSPKSKHNHWL